MPMVHVSGTNVFIPQATGQSIAYARDPKRFPLMRYVQFIETPTPVGLYYRLDPDYAVRVKPDEHYHWADNATAPEEDDQGRFEQVEFRCMRRAYPYTIGEQVVDTAQGWNPQAFFNAGILSKAMTNKTRRVITLMETAANWGGMTADANTLNGGAGQWHLASNDPASVNYMAITKTLLRAVELIHLATNGVVQKEDLLLILSPGAARTMATSPEIRDYLKSSPAAFAQARGDVPGMNTNFGLPDQYAGLEILVDNTMHVNSNQLASGALAVAEADRLYVKSKTSAIIVSKAGGVDGQYGAPSFSTIQCYYWKYQLTVEAMHDVWNKRYKARVVDQFKEILAAPATGFLITNIMPA